jgi:signal recognition particle receptor subunit beta
MSRRATMVRRQTKGKVAGARPLKVVVTGPFSAGKTTLIKTISEVAILATDRDVTDEGRSVKERTTVAMDFGRISFADDLSLFLFGTPGQRRFEVMWEILSEGMLGFILLVNAGDHRSIVEASHILETFKRYADVPYVVGITHADEASGAPGETVADLRSTLELPDGVAALECDPRDREDVKALLLDLLAGVLTRVNGNRKRK